MAKYLIMILLSWLMVINPIIAAFCSLYTIILRYNFIKVENNEKKKTFVQFAFSLYLLLYFWLFIIVLPIISKAKTEDGKRIKRKNNFYVILAYSQILVLNFLLAWQDYYGNSYYFHLW